MTQHKQVVNIGDTDRNADWIKTPENRKSEREIYERLKKQREQEQAEKPK